MNTRKEIMEFLLTREGVKIDPWCLEEEQPQDVIITLNSGKRVGFHFLINGIYSYTFYSNFPYGNLEHLDVPFLEAYAFLDITQ